MADIPVPPGLHDMLQGFVVNVLRHRPSDLIEFAAQYFSDLLDNRDQARGGGATMGSATNQDDEEMVASDNDDYMDEAEEMAMMARRTNVSRRKSVSAEGFDPDADDDDDEEKVIHPKTDEQRDRLSKVISKMLIFSSLDIEQTQQVLDAMFEKSVKAGDHVIDEGDDGDNFYVIEKGDFDIFINDPVTKVPDHKGTYKGSGAFGELALMYNCPRLATIIATTDGSLWGMDRTTFRRIIVKNAAKKRKQYEDFLATVPLLSTLTVEERMKVADAMVTKNYEDEDCILKQGDPADYFYIVIDGQVVVKRRGDDPSNANHEVVLKKYTNGEYFGELALIQNQPRAASAFAEGPCKCAVLDVQAFERLLGPCKELLMRNIPLYEQQLSEIYQDMSMSE
uniref:cAMP-dependent protein kinase type II regulatory subunit-like n=2 Tax=Ciona intestinalis TaxID=7719 RepID=F6S8B5_CIOIN|nr:cAMP-dependent protein kinase type II regulatory subunit-like isoform X1 [Ciona intestinalis]|eukprot:XP_002128915.1 cAMP-dependent protein kinase type II regulatory subunit-like isoform X1 [Ciona intestinalis]